MNLKQITIICALVCTLSVHLSNAQGDRLNIGDQAPPLLAYEWVKGEPMVEFKKGMPYVIELGATWCKPCAKAIPELTALAQKYKGKAEVIGVFVMEPNTEPLSVKKPKYVERVKQYVGKQGSKMEYNVAVDDPEKTIERTWLRAAGSVGVPKTFVIDKEGYIAWIGEGYNPELTDQLLQSMDDGSYKLNTFVKYDRDKKASETSYDRAQPLLVNGNGGDENDFDYRSLITKYKGDFKAPTTSHISSYGWAKTPNLAALQGTVQVVRTPIERLYYLAYGDTLRYHLYTRSMGTFKYPDTVANPHLKSSHGKYWHKSLLEIKDNKPFQYDINLKKADNLWNYSLKVPKEKATAKFLQEAMRRDLKTYFGYDVTVEKRLMPCWFLKASPQAVQKLKTKTPGAQLRYIEYEQGGGKTLNGEIADFIIQFTTTFGVGYTRNPIEAPFIDMTGITTEIDYDRTGDEVQSFKELNFEAARKSLERHGLYLEKGEKWMKVVIIRDPKNI
ncbi:TlpA family protein disulfide reductase [Fulvivirga sp. M361]|uniref:TlpA family protein disulfide reductase n=1 Tax=Fulvivirga sp. M361 TaxID=2594266 RepID=UPI00117B50E4|nr:TlpA disulfide reductase family protein [Fulvivirga sp. M361]TRX61186.1 TlpA family protein disulfide reductase [Fulvivirga sp. M361]